MMLRSDRFDPDDPANMDADERRDELVSIFARGILRLHGRVPGDISGAQNLEDSSPTYLELSATSSPVAIDERVIGDDVEEVRRRHLEELGMQGQGEARKPSGPRQNFRRFTRCAYGNPRKVSVIHARIARAWSAGPESHSRSSSDCFLRQIAA